MGETHIAGHDHARARTCREITMLEERSGRTQTVLRAPPGKYTINPVIEYQGRHVKITVSKALNRAVGQESRRKKKLKGGEPGRTQTVKLSRQSDDEHIAFVHSVDLETLNYENLHAFTLNYPRGFTGTQIRQVCTRLLRSLQDKYGDALAGFLRREWSPPPFAIFHEHGVAYFASGTPPGFPKFLEKCFRRHVRKAGGEATLNAVLIEGLASQEDCRKWNGYAWKRKDGADKPRLRDIAYLPEGGNWIHYFRGEMPMVEARRRGKMSAAQFLVFLVHACAMTGSEPMDLRPKVFAIDPAEIARLMMIIEKLPDDAVPWELPEGVARMEFDAFIIVPADGMPSSIEIYYGDHIQALPVIVEMETLSRWISDLRRQILAEGESAVNSIADVPEQMTAPTENDENIPVPRRSNTSTRLSLGPLLVGVLLVILHLAGHAVRLCLRVTFFCVQEFCVWEASRSPSRPEG